MLAHSKAEELRELLRVAKLLRSYVSTRTDASDLYIFDKAAEALEMRAHRIAEKATLPQRKKVDFTC